MVHLWGLFSAVDLVLLGVFTAAGHVLAALISRIPLLLVWVISWDLLTVRIIV